MQPVQERILRELIGHFYLNETDFAQQMKNAGIDWETAPIWCMLIKAGEIYRFEEVRMRTATRYSFLFATLRKRL